MSNLNLWGFFTFSQPGSVQEVCRKQHPRSQLLGVRNTWVHNCISKSTVLAQQYRVILLSDCSKSLASSRQPLSPSCSPAFMSLCILITLPFDTRFSAAMGICSVQTWRWFTWNKSCCSATDFKLPPLPPILFFFFLLYQVQASCSPLQDPPQPSALAAVTPHHSPLSLICYCDRWLTTVQQPLTFFRVLLLSFRSGLHFWNWSIERVPLTLPHSFSRLVSWMTHAKNQLINT